MCTCMRAQMLSHVRLFATPWTVACQAPLSMGFSSKENWSGLPLPSPGDHPDPGIKPMSLASISCTGGRTLYYWRHLGSPIYVHIYNKYNLQELIEIIIIIIFC